MKLYEYLRAYSDWELTVFDVDYDIETYFYKDDQDDWSRTMWELSKLLEVIAITQLGVSVNLSQVISEKLDKLEDADLFIDPSLDAIMDDIESILAGGVSEEWLREFVEALK